MSPGQRKTQKNFSTKEAQDAFITICPSEAIYKEMYNAKVAKESGMPPYITIIGTMLEPKDIIIDFENVMYKMQSLSKAIDICMKVYHLFEIEYSPAARLMWQFINKKFYELPGDSVYPSVLMVIKNIDGKIITFSF